MTVLYCIHEEEKNYEKEALNSDIYILSIKKTVLELLKIHRRFHYVSGYLICIGLM